jgi:hypothetical protein
VILVRVFAGIGNQLFQYAAAQALGRRLGAPVRFDTHTWYTGRGRRQSTRRESVLRELGLPVDEASPKERAAPWVRQWWGGRRRREGWTFLGQNGADLAHEALARAVAPVFFEGYWQGECYFGDYRSELTAQLLGLAPDAERNQRWLAAVRAPGAVAIHVRRGDYVTNGARSPAYRVLPVEYYQAALERLRKSGAVESVVVFSDDPDWCARELRLGIPTLIVRREDAAASAAEDLLCLAQASALITANSTFSWWGAWIATQRGRARVVAPAEWFHDLSFAAWSRQLQVPGWEQL